jgi:hypothetical protein
MFCIVSFDFAKLFSISKQNMDWTPAEKWERQVCDSYSVYSLQPLEACWVETEVKGWRCSSDLVFILNFIHLAIPKFELRALHLLDRCSTTWAIHSAIIFSFLPLLFYSRVSYFLSSASLRPLSYLCLLCSWDSGCTTFTIGFGMKHGKCLLTTTWLLSLRMNFRVD